MLDNQSIPITTDERYYATFANAQVWDANKDELTRVDTFNEYYCAGYNEYLLKVRDVTSEINPNNNLSSSLIISSIYPSEYFNISQNIFDNRDDTFFEFESTSEFLDYDESLSDYINQREDFFGHQSNINIFNIN